MTQPAADASGIPIYLTRHVMPEPHQTVIVAGGLACWTGSIWLSMSDDRRPISWAVKWWAPLIYATEGPKENSDVQSQLAALIRALTRDLRAGKIKLLRYGKPCRVLYRPTGGTMAGSDEEEREFREQQNKPVPVDLFGCCEPE
jgi:hypothetical protein